MASMIAACGGEQRPQAEIETRRPLFSLRRTNPAALQIAAAAGQQLTTTESIDQVTGQAIAGTRQTEHAMEDPEALSGETTETVQPYQ